MWLQSFEDSPRGSNIVIKEQDLNLDFGVEFHLFLLK